MPKQCNDLTKKELSEWEDQSYNFGTNSSDFASKLLELCKDNDESIKITATELMTKLSEFNLTSTKDLANKMNRYGIKSKSFRIGNKVARYYTLDKEKIIKYITIPCLTTIPGLDGEIYMKEEENGQ